MAFLSRELSVLAYANGFTLWHYRTTDTAAVVDGSGYFNRVAETMRVGDLVVLTAGLGGAPAHGLLVVVSNSGGVVDTSNMTVVGDSNSD